MRRLAVVYFLAAGGALCAAVLGGEGKKTSLGRLTEKLGTMREYRSCEETYGMGWATCGGSNSGSCYSPALGHSCCDVDNRYCRKGTWCAPVAGYCCLDNEDLVTCARNARFKPPDAQAPASFKPPPIQKTTSDTWLNDI
ncbi:hypothetical protein B0J18DRAFT_6988 [Chaetomium sp. MPI-SDFR-AT-0129]|nr:hypothetical protein B0J18DRAFT_6988 [Chaetomium sp. MPI-SDFR-AT-0129]